MVYYFCVTILYFGIFRREMRGNFVLTVYRKSLPPCRSHRSFLCGPSSCGRIGALRGTQGSADRAGAPLAGAGAGNPPVAFSGHGARQQGQIAGNAQTLQQQQLQIQQSMMARQAGGGLNPAGRPQRAAQGAATGDKPTQAERQRYLRLMSVRSQINVELDLGLTPRSLTTSENALQGNPAALSKVHEIEGKIFAQASSRQQYVQMIESLVRNQQAQANQQAAQRSNQGLFGRPRHGPSLPQRI